MSRHRVPIVYLALNVALAAAYLGLASISWTEPELRDYPGASGGAPIVWGLTAVPVFLLALLANLGVLAWAWRGGRIGAVAKPAWAVAALWLCALAIDFAHH
jgi:hypothetical protein